MTLPLQILRTVAKHYPDVLPHLAPETLAAVKAGNGYPGVRSDYFHAIYDAVYDYLTGNSPITSYRNSAQRAAADAFIGAAEIGYQEGGAELPFDDDTLAWLGAAQEAELGHIADLFSRLKEEWEGLDPAAEAAARAEGYTRTLDSILTEAKMRGSENATLEFGGDSGKESCKTCMRMMGKRHRISYILSHGLIPHPGNTNFECNCYNCEHYWFNPKTGERFDG